MICNKCNFQNEDTAKFCRNCGAELDRVYSPPPPKKPEKSPNVVPWVLLVIALIVCAVLGFLLYENNRNGSEATIPEPTPNPKKEGVVINGVTWAKKNLGAIDAEDYGAYYTWEEAQAACPKGWRLPTEEEFESLINKGSKWTTYNGANGRIFGDSDNYIFLPAAGGMLDDIQYMGGGSFGGYWSTGKQMLFDKAIVHIVAVDVRDSDKIRYSVRLVAE